MNNHHYILLIIGEEAVENSRSTVGELAKDRVVG